MTWLNWPEKGRKCRKLQSPQIPAVLVPDWDTTRHTTVAFPWRLRSKYQQPQTMPHPTRDCRPSLHPNKTKFPSASNERGGWGACRNLKSFSAVSSTSSGAKVELVHKLPRADSERLPIVKLTDCTAEKVRTLCASLEELCSLGRFRPARRNHPTAGRARHQFQASRRVSAAS